MKYIVLIVIGAVILLIVSIYLILKTYKMLKGKKAKVSMIGLNVFLILVFTLFICIVAVSTSYNYFFEKGANLIDQGKYHEAIEPLKTALAIRNRTGNLAELLDKRILGVPLFFSTEIDIRMTMANSYNYLKEYQKAIKEYQIIISMDNNNYNAIANIAENYFLTRNFAKAQQYYQKLTEILPKEKDVNYYIQIGKAYMVLVDYENAINNFKRALEFGEKENIVNRYLEICLKEKTSRVNSSNIQ